MDFASLLQGEISKRKGASDGKSVKRGDIEARRRQEYLDQQEEERKRREEKKRKKDEEEERERQRYLRKRKLQETLEIHGLLDDESVVRQLRKYGQPKQYFAESVEDRRDRLRKCTEDGKRQGSDPAAKGEEEEIPVDLDSAIDIEKIRPQNREIEKKIHAWIQHTIAHWRDALDSNVRHQLLDKGLDEANLMQCNKHLDALLRRIRRNQLSKHVYPLLSRMIAYIQQKQYHLANDDYLKLSIGQQAWPIGLAITAESHEKNENERFFDSRITTMLTDEETRKWLGSIKRLLTFAEIRWPKS